MMKFRIALIIMLCPLLIKAQQNTQKNKIIPFFLFDSYYSFIGNRDADVWGFKGGVEWNKKWRFGAGFNKIKSDIVEYKKLPDSELAYSNSDSVKAQLYLRYYPVMAEYVFYDNNPWQLSTPMSIGYGRSYFQYFDKENGTRTIYNHGVLVSDFGVNAQYKFVKWVGLGAGLGYRIMIIDNPEISTNFNSPIFSIRLKLFLGEIYQTIFPDSKFLKSNN